MMLKKKQKPKECWKLEFKKQNEISVMKKYEFVQELSANIFTFTASLGNNHK